MKIFSTLLLCGLIQGKSNSEPGLHFELFSVLIICLLEMTADAKGKLNKLNKRAGKIYVDYLADWPLAENYLKKLYKMQVCLNYLKIFFKNYF